MIFSCFILISQSVNQGRCVNVFPLLIHGLYLIPAHVPGLGHPVLRIFHKIPGGKPEIGLCIGENAHHPVSAPGFLIGAFKGINGGDFPIIHSLKGIKLEGVFQAIFQAANRFGETLAVFGDYPRGRPAGGCFIRLSPNLFNSGGKMFFRRMRYF